MPDKTVNARHRDIPVVILAGGLGINLGPQGSLIPKAMVAVEGQPLLKHTIDRYVAAGFSRFVVCAGAGIGLIRDYAAKGLTGLDLSILDTGEASMTGSRLFQAREHAKGDLFCLTYGDTYADVDLGALLDFHRAHGKTASLVAVHPQTRFRILGMVDDDDAIRGFANKPILQKDFINGGYYVLGRGVFDCPKLSADPGCVLETDVLEYLVEKRDINALRFEGFWQQIDTDRDRSRIARFLTKGQG